MLRGLQLGVLVTGLMVVMGCGGPQTASVSGKVNLDGKPLQEGEIYFIGEGKAPEILEIRSGGFSGNVTLGKKKVEINSFKEGPPVPKGQPGEGEKSKENIIPPQYNAQSKFSEEIKAGGPNEFKYDLKSK